MNNGTKYKAAIVKLLMVLLVTFTLTACLGKDFDVIKGWVFIDNNANGIRDADEKQVAGVTVNLLNEKSETIASTQTNAAGEYEFNVVGTTLDGKAVLVFEAPDTYEFQSKPNDGQDDVDSDVSTTGRATLDTGRKDGKTLHIDALLLSRPGVETGTTPTPTSTPSPPTATPTATPIPRSGFSDPEEDAVSAITGQPIPDGYPALDIQEIDWKIENGIITVEIAVDVPLADKPEVFEWGLQVGVATHEELLVHDFATLPDGSTDAQYTIISETLTSVPTALPVNALFNPASPDIIQFTFNTDMAQSDDASIFVRGFSRVEGMVGVIDSGIWPEHPGFNDRNSIPWVPVNSDSSVSRLDFTKEEWKALLTLYEDRRSDFNHLPGWQADRSTSFEDPTGDVYNASSLTLLGQPDPGVDILYVDVHPAMTDTMSVDVFVATSPISTTLLDFSFYSEVAVRDNEGNEYVVAYEIHDGVKQQGLLNISTFLPEPGTEGYVRIFPDRISMLIPGTPGSGEVFVGNFHMENENSIRTYDESVNNSFSFTTQYDLDAALAKKEGVTEIESTVTPAPTSTQVPTPTAMPETTATPTPTVQPTPTTLPPTFTPTVVAIAPIEGGYSGIFTSTFVVTDTGNFSPVDVAYVFLNEYGSAHDEKKVEWLMGTLHPDSIDRYGLQQCELYLEQVTGCCEDFTAVDSEYPVDFVYDKDNIITEYSGAVRLQVEFTVKGETQPRESTMHILIGQYDTYWYANWFTDCGDPEQ